MKRQYACLSILVIYSSSSLSLASGSPLRSQVNDAPNANQPAGHLNECYRLFPSSAFCDSKCKARFSRASLQLQDRCLKFCGQCCMACHCVPSGTFGNKDECLCYRDKFTGVGVRRRPKCP